MEHEIIRRDIAGWRHCISQFLAQMLKSFSWSVLGGKPQKYHTEPPKALAGLQPPWSGFHACIQKACGQPILNSACGRAQRGRKSQSRYARCFPPLLINLQHSWTKTELLQTAAREFLSHFPRPALGWGSAEVSAWNLLGVMLEPLVVVEVGLESSVSWMLLTQTSWMGNQPRHPLTQRQ